MIIAYILLLLAFAIIFYHGAGFIFKKWDEFQEKRAQKTAAQFEEMFVFLRKDILITLYIVVPIALGVIGFIFTQKLWVGLIFMIVGAFTPLYLVKIVISLRNSKLNSQLADGLMIMSSCLKGGLTLIQSFKVLSEEMAMPLSHEIALLIKEVQVGVSLEEALVRLGKRTPSEEIDLIVSAVLVARETGGDLTKVFSRLVATIRDRKKLKEMIQTLTVQARLQAVLISLLGPVFAMIVVKINPEHFTIMWENEMGRIALIAACFLQFLGIVMIIIFGKVRI